MDDLYGRTEIDIVMEFGLEQCAIIAVNHGKITNSNGIKMLNGQIIRSLQSIWAFYR